MNPDGYIMGYNANTFFTLWTVDWETPVILAVFWTDWPDLRFLMTDLYSDAYTYPHAFPNFSLNLFKFIT